MALPIRQLNAQFEGEFEFKRKMFRVPFTLPGDLVQFQFRFRGPKHERFKVLHIEKAESYPAEVRQAEPFCPAFANCGGCRAQHLEYDYQLEIKCTPIQERMAKLTGVRPELLPAPEQRAYRNRMDFVVNGDDLGMRPAGDFASFVDLERCEIQSPVANAALAICREVLARPEFAGVAFRRVLPAASEESAPPVEARGVLKYITIRSGAEAAMVVLTVHGSAREEPAYRSFREALGQALQQAGSSTLGSIRMVETATEAIEAEVSNPPGGHAVLGADSFPARLGGLEFDVPYDAFFQPNPVAFDGLLNAARPWLQSELQAELDLSAAGDGDGLAAQGAAVLIDLYSGAGVLSAIIVSWFPGVFSRVRGYESTASAVERAPANFAAAGITGPEIDFHTVDLLQPPEDFLNEAARLIVLDPPRAGLSPAVRAALLEHRPAPVLLYISCNPNSQLRDLEELAPAYAVECAVLADCFPHTPHLEQAVLLRRRD